MRENFELIYDELYAWCESRGFAGSDPFDGLNSRIFQATPLKDHRLPRLALTQLVKRSPVNLRRLLKVPPGVNPKGVALFALAELSRYRATRFEEHASRARELLDRLLTLAIREGDTLAFGYNFDWQSRVFFAPKGTPTIVPTAFVSQAFAEGFAAFNDASYHDAVRSIARFAATKLNRPVDTDGEVCFSYTPLDRSVIFNAGLLAGECLARSNDAEHHDLARRAVNFVIGRQCDNGAWDYGEAGSQSWVDNFHTAYVLQSIMRISEAVGTSAAWERSFERGMSYWLENFFLNDGTPKYYDHETYPIDIHSAAVAVAALAELGQPEMATKVASWTTRHMLDVDGFFYYRLGRLVADEIPHMRWGQAWMAYALARLIEQLSK